MWSCGIGMQVYYVCVHDHEHDVIYYIQTVEVVWYTQGQAQKRHVDRGQWGQTARTADGGRRGTRPGTQTGRAVSCDERVFLHRYFTCAYHPNDLHTLYTDGRIEPASSNQGGWVE